MVWASISDTSAKLCTSPGFESVHPAVHIKSAGKSNWLFIPRTLMWEITQRHPGDYPHQLIFATLMIHDYTQYDHTSARTRNMSRCINTMITIWLFHDDPTVIFQHFPTLITLWWIYPLKMVIFHSYVKLPEGTLQNPPHHGYPNDPMAMMPRLPSAVA